MERKVLQQSESALSYTRVIEFGNGRIMFSAIETEINENKISVETLIGGSYGSE